MAAKSHCILCNSAKSLQHFPAFGLDFIFIESLYSLILHAFLSVLPELCKSNIKFSLNTCLNQIRPVVSYGAEAWTLIKKEEQALLIFERKIFRRIYGPKYEKGDRKSRTYRELEEMSKGENIVKWIKGQRIS